MKVRGSLTEAKIAEGVKIHCHRKKRTKRKSGYLSTQEGKMKIKKKIGEGQKEPTASSAKAGSHGATEP